MVYTSTYYTEMLHFTMTVDDITVDAVYRAFMEPRYSYFAIWTLDHRTGRASFVSVRREHFVSFAWHLRNRSSESTYHTSIFWDVISQDLSMTNFIQTEPNNSRMLYCIRIQLHSMARQDAHLPIDRRQPLVDVVDIPICQARDLANHADRVMNVIDSSFDAPPELPLIRFFGLRSPGMDFHWDHYLTRESILANEGPHVTLIEEGSTPANAEEGPSAPVTSPDTVPDTVPLTAPVMSPDVTPDTAPVTTPGNTPTTAVEEEGAGPMETEYSPVPVVDPIAEPVCEHPSALVTGRTTASQFDAAVTHPHARESPELIDLYGMLEDHTRAEQATGRLTQPTPLSDAPAASLATVQSPVPVPPVSQAAEAVTAPAPESRAPLPQATMPPVSQAREVVTAPVPESCASLPQAPLDLSSLRMANQGPLHADELFRERPTTQLACRYLVCRAYEARIVARRGAPLRQRTC